MGKRFLKNRRLPNGSAPPALRKSLAAPRCEAAARRLAKKKSISFDPNRNKVSFIRVPPRSKNPEYWFSERHKVVRKGLQFEIDADVSVEVNVESRLQLGAMVYPRKVSAASSPSSSPPPPPRAPAAERAFLEVKEVLVPLFGDADEDNVDATDGKWWCVGSVGAGGMSKLNVTLPAGMYQLRCRGSRRSLQVFGQAWDVEMELV